MELVVSALLIGVVFGGIRFRGLAQRRLLGPSHRDCPHCGAVLRAYRSICPSCAKYL